MAKTITAPASTFPAITPHASNDFPEGVCRGIYVGATGDIAAVSANGEVTQFKNAAQGSVIPIMARRVNSVGTSATDLVALY